MVDDPEDIVTRLLQAGQRLPDDLRREVIALGGATVPSLVALLERDVERADWAPVHAARLLGELAAVDAIEPM